MHRINAGTQSLVLRLVVHLLSYSRLKSRKWKCKRFSILANQMYSIPDTHPNMKLKQQQKRQTFSQQTATRLPFNQFNMTVQLNCFVAVCTNNHRYPFKSLLENQSWEIEILKHMQAARVAQHRLDHSFLWLRCVSGVLNWLYRNQLNPVRLYVEGQKAWREDRCAHRSQLIKSGYWKRLN